MGLTKRAVTIYGLQVPMDKIVDEHVNIINKCICVPKNEPLSNDVKFCPKCGRSVSHRSRTISVKKGLGIEVDKDYNLIIADYPTSGRAGEGDCIYVGIMVSKTDATYPAEGADPVMYDMPLITDLDISVFQKSMQKHDLWDHLKFGLWTILLIE